MRNRITFIITLLLTAGIACSVVNSGKVRAQKIVDNVYQLTDTDFDKYTKSGTVMVDFWAVWCGPCRIQSPIVDEIAQEIGQKAIIAKVNVDVAKVTSSRFNIKYIPTIMIFQNGSLKKRFTGVTDKETLVHVLDSLQGK